MQKPVVLTAYLGDSLSLRLAVYDASGAAFSSSSWEIDEVALEIPFLTASVEGSISANLASFLIPADTFSEAGDFAFYVQLKNSTDGYVFTVLGGTIRLVPLPA